MSVQRQLQELSEKKRPVLRLVFATLCFAMLLVCMFASWQIWASRTDTTEAAAIATSNMARGLALHAETTFKIADLVLTDMVERAEHDGMVGAQQERLRAHLEHLSDQARELHGLFLYDENGEWIATSLRRVVKANNSDREYFRYHRTYTSLDARIGAPIRSRSTGVWIIPVSRRLNHPDGSFAGVALATLRLDFFEAAYSKLNVGKTGTVLLALTNGTLYYRRPFVERNIGHDISAGPLMNTYRNTGKVGTAMLTAKIDNVERLYSYRELDGFPLLVAVALSSDEIYSQWKTTTFQVGAGLALINAFLFWVGRRLLRQLAIRERLEEQLETLSNGLLQANLELSSMAMKDGLTQIANRRAFDAALMREYGRATRERQPISLLMLDVDHFKKFNDHYGHPAGDACLRQIAMALARSVTRPSDLAARFGGEEFAVLLPATTVSGAMKVAEKIRDAIVAASIVHESSPTGCVTVSIGVATIESFESTSGTSDRLISAADAALYQAKNTGRNRISVGSMFRVAETKAA